MGGQDDLRKVQAGVYETLDGRYRIEHQDGLTDCEHPLCDTLHRKWHERTGGRYGAGTGWVHMVPYPAWHVWDTVRDDYAIHDEFDTKRDAHHWLMGHLADKGADHADQA